MNSQKDILKDDLKTEKQIYRSMAGEMKRLRINNIVSNDKS